MNDSVAHEALNKLMNQANRGKSSTVAFTDSRLPEYGKIRNAEERTTAHAILTNAERAGAISIEWERFFEGHKVERIRLVDHDALASFLGQSTLADRVDAASAVIRPAIDKDYTPDWMRDVCESVFDRWMDGKKPYGLEPEDATDLHDICILANYLDHDPFNTLDMRTVSVRLFGKTKRIEGILSSLVQIYREHLGMDGASPDEVMAEVSLSKYPWPILVSGPVRFFTRDEETLNASVYPFIGFPPDASNAFEIGSDARFLLTIENLSSFNTYTRSPRCRIAGGIILYTNGFPSHNMMDKYEGLAVAVMSRGLPVYHWGDTDVGGLRILAKLQERVRDHGVIVLPHMMSSFPSDVGEPFSQSELKAIQKMEYINHGANQLIEAITSGVVRKGEQEFLDPSPPQTASKQEIY